MSAITGGITISQPQSNSTATHTSAADALSAVLGQQLGAATSALLDKVAALEAALAKQGK